MWLVEKLADLTVFELVGKLAEMWVFLWVAAMELMLAEM